MTRGVTFWSDETIRLIRENFVSASVPTWLCRVNSPEGAFLREAGIDNQWVTSSGYMSCVSASGKLLGHRPSAEVLDAFGMLPESERRPGAVAFAELAPGDVVIPSPPRRGLVLRVHARFLGRDAGDGLRHARASDFPLMRDRPEIQRGWQLFLQPNTEYMWLTREEWQSMIPSNPVLGSRIEVGRGIAERMARFHLTPQRAMTSEGGIKGERSIRAARIALVVSDLTPRALKLELEGFVHWGSDYDEAKATTPDGPLAQGFETQLHGQLEYDREREAFTRFDIVAPGEVWGRWGDANGKSMYVERPGRSPFGFAFELVSGDSPTDRIPPGGNARDIERAGYFADRDE